VGGCAWQARRTSAKVVVIGGGYGGAAAAKYVRLLSNQAIEVVLIERNPQFISAPLSNLVIGGVLTLAELTLPYDGLRRRHGVDVVVDAVTGIDTAKKTVVLAGGASIRYDKLLLSPGIEPVTEAIAGLAQAQAGGAVLAGWSAGAETLGLRAQLAAMPDGGVFAITIPEAPYRCPPAPYERASLVAAFLRRHKPKSKVLVLDANPDVIAMKSLFKAAWAELYGGLLEYRNHDKAVAVDPAGRTLRFEVDDDVRADVLNVLPPVRAGALARAAGLAAIDGRWCEVNFLTFESALAKDVHIIGDAIQAATMPKSGHAANGQAKVAAAAIVAELQGREPNPRPMLTNACYSFVSVAEAIHSTMVYEYAAAAAELRPVAGAGGTSPARSALEGAYAMAWARNIWADMLS
jgi:NADPH-dependent 2,4-dienoyl-CoA reductase/sulfur reductase-like enzyme